MLAENVEFKNFFSGTRKVERVSLGRWPRSLYLTTTLNDKTSWSICLRKTDDVDELIYHSYSRYFDLPERFLLTENIFSIDVIHGSVFQFISMPIYGCAKCSSLKFQRFFFSKKKKDGTSVVQFKTRIIFIQLYGQFLHWELFDWLKCGIIAYLYDFNWTSMYAQTTKIHDILVC